MDNKTNNLFFEHKIIEISGLTGKIITKSEFIIPYLEKLVKRTNLKVLKKEYHNFTPFGATVLFILSSSHLAVHTWPEKNYIHLDLFTCSALPDDKSLSKLLEKIFGITQENIKIRKIKYE